ncbi:MAG: hypothetical protein MUD16_13225 [Desulfobacterales bacterium]|nr:hypothetical protein [Desulfobacterales bacterium]
MISTAEGIFFTLLTALYFLAAALVDKRTARCRAIREDEYLSCLAMARQCSVYQVFRSAGADWRFSAAKIDSDFAYYLREGFIPRYVVRFSKSHVTPEDVKMYCLMSRGW